MRVVDEKKNVTKGGISSRTREIATCSFIDNNKPMRRKLLQEKKNPACLILSFNHSQQIVSPLNLAFIHSFIYSINQQLFPERLLCASPCSRHGIED